MRIISLAPSNTEILYALGVEPIAVTRYCNYPAQAKEKPTVGGWLDTDFERIEELAPDMVLTSMFVQEEIVTTLQERGILTFHSDPRTLVEVYASILAIGRLVHKEKAAQDLITTMKQDLLSIKDEMKDFGAKVYCEEWHNPPTVSGNWVPELIEVAGGKSLAYPGEISTEVSLTTVKIFDPDLIVLSLCGFGKRATSKTVSIREGWDGLRVVKENKIFVLDDSLLNRPGPRLVQGARELAKIIKNLKRR